MNLNIDVGTLCLECLYHLRRDGRLVEVQCVEMLGVDEGHQLFVIKLGKEERQRLKAGHGC